jgi:hypothetical protein
MNPQSKIASYRNPAVARDEQVYRDSRRDVSQYLSIYQAVIAMVSLFTGFVFVGLLQLLTGSERLDIWRITIVWLLMLALVSLTTALLCFHATAHRVVRYWRISYPLSIFNRVAAWAFNLGLLAMYLSLAALMMSCGLQIAAAVMALSGFGFVVFGLVTRRMHGSADYMIRVDTPLSSNQSMQPTADRSDE